RQTEQAAVGGIIGLLRAANAADNTPLSIFGRDEAVGRDPTSAVGGFQGAIGNSLGFGGLAMLGTGRGAGGRGDGTIGLGDLGTLGHARTAGNGSSYGAGAASY